MCGGPCLVQFSDRHGVRLLITADPLFQCLLIFSAFPEQGHRSCFHPLVTFCGLPVA